MRKITFITLFALLSFGGYSQTKVACVGNSITYGAGLVNRDTESYPVQLNNLLGDEYVVGNFGRSGATLLNKGHNPYTKVEEYQKSLDFAPDIVVIHLGINDTDPRNWPAYRDEFITDYLSLIESYRGVNPDVRVIISRLSPIIFTHSRFNSGTKLWHTLIQEEIEVVAKRANVELIDFYNTLYRQPQLIPDGLHPNAEGAKLMAQTAYSAISGDYGGLQLSPVYSDNMVLQRGDSLRINGIANSGDVVEVRINGIKAKAISNNRGEWSVRLDNLVAGGPYELTIKAGKKKQQFKNVMIGEVWLCSGQSNMAWKFKNSDVSEQDIKIDTSMIRLFDMQPIMAMDGAAWSESQIDAINSLNFYKPTAWSCANTQAVGEFSAIAMHFGKMLQDSLGVAVGLIHNAIGGATTEAWIDRHTLESKFPLILPNWLSNDFVMDWVRGRAAENLVNSKDNHKLHPYISSYLYDTGITPLEQFPIKGVIWYQGESNAHNIDTHESLFELLIESWRNNWNNDQMPFYYVQLSSINRPTWTWFRDSQRQFLQRIPNVGMAVSSDKGNPTDVHPRQKLEVGSRLARLALNKSYGLDITASGPLFKDCVVEGNRLIISFENGDNLKTSDSNELQLFEIAGYDKQFEIVTPKIEGDKIVIETKDANSVKYVRYGWRPYSQANLVNGDNLPASTFLYEIIK
ncbi:MAG: GDSL-type esterase/lipase family protein [Rikenellaceae bacterium]